MFAFDLVFFLVETGEGATVIEHVAAAAASAVVEVALVLVVVLALENVVA